MRNVTRFLALLVAATFLFTPGADAQVSITGSDILNLIGEYQRIESDFSQAGITVNVGSAGANQSWDFTTISTSGDSFTRAFLSPSQTPFAAEFPTANFVFNTVFTFDTTTVEEYGFNFIDNSAINELGDAQVVNDTSFVEVAENPQSIALPVSLNSTWTDFEADTLDFGGGNLSIFIDSTFNVADAWGTAQTAIGSLDVLRLRANDVSISKTFVAGNLVSSDTTTQIEYQWISPEHFVVAVLIGMEDDDDPNFTMASEVQLVAAITTGIETPDDREASLILGVFPNPTSSSVDIDIDSPDRIIDVGIFNVIGQRVATLSTSSSPGKRQISWDGNSNAGISVSPGVYFVRVHADTGIQTKKFVLLK